MKKTQSKRLADIIRRYVRTAIDESTEELAKRLADAERRARDAEERARHLDRRVDFIYERMVSDD